MFVEKIYFSRVVNKSPPGSFIFMETDEQERDVSNAAANVLMTSDLINSADSRTPDTAISENAAFDDLAVLFRDYHQAIFRIAYRITGSRSDAEDVLQTIFLRLAPNHSRANFLPNAGGYLHRAAVNASLDLLRKRARQNSVSLEVVDFEPNAALSATSPETDLADAELRAFVRQAAAKLEGRAATAFALRYFEGLENNRIAEILGTSQMVVAVTLHRARTKMRKEISQFLEKHNEA